MDTRPSQNHWQSRQGVLVLNQDNAKRLHHERLLASRRTRLPNLMWSSRTRNKTHLHPRRWPHRGPRKPCTRSNRQRNRPPPPPPPDRRDQHLLLLLNPISTGGRPWDRRRRENGYGQRGLRKNSCPSQPQVKLSRTMRRVLPRIKPCRGNPHRQMKYRSGGNVFAINIDILLPGLHLLCSTELAVVAFQTVSCVPVGRTIVVIPVLLQHVITIVPFCCWTPSTSAYKTINIE